MFGLNFQKRRELANGVRACRTARQELRDDRAWYLGALDELAMSEHSTRAPGALMTGAAADATASALSDRVIHHCRRTCGARPALRAPLGRSRKLAREHAQARRPKLTQSLRMTDGEPRSGLEYLGGRQDCFRGGTAMMHVSRDCVEFRPRQADRNRSFRRRAVPPKLRQLRGLAYDP
jgi:hypothetical protein